MCNWYTEYIDIQIYSSACLANMYVVLGKLNINVYIDEVNLYESLVFINMNDKVKQTKIK